MNRLHRAQFDRSARRRGFTLAELIIATVITTFVLSTLTVSFSQLGRAKETSQLRLNAHLRADVAMTQIRADIASVIRHDDLFWTRLLIQSSTERTPYGEMDRDSILVFNTRLRALHDLDFSGEGMQYETQYRVQDHDHGAMLWRRSDPVPDDHPLAGGIATPAVEGVISLRFEAFDGFDWFDYWDSDEFGLPRAVRITLVSSGARSFEDLAEAPRAVLRTVVAIDRVTPPANLFAEDGDEEAEPEELEDVSDPTVRAAEQERRERTGGGAERGPGARPGAQPRSPDGARGGRGGDGAAPSGSPRRPGGGGAQSGGSTGQRMRPN